jgi:hypothetical protein
MIVLNKVDLLEELLLSDSGLIISLRMGDGLNVSLVDEICMLLDKLKVEWEKKDSIPKKAVDLFVDFYPAMESCEGLYNEKEFTEILDAADKIMNYIRACYCNY